MNEITERSVLPPSTPACIDLIDRVCEQVKRAPQIDLVTHHVLHGGIYSRTISLEPGVVLTGTLVKVPTTLVISGAATVLFGDGEEAVVRGYLVLAASARRKQAFITHDVTHITMSFRTDAKTVEEAESEFTDEADALMSRTGRNIVVVTGE